MKPAEWFDEEVTLTKAELWDLRAFALQAGVDQLPNAHYVNSALSKCAAALDGTGNPPPPQEHSKGDNPNPASGEPVPGTTRDWEDEQQQLRLEEAAARLDRIAEELPEGSISRSDARNEADAIREALAEVRRLAEPVQRYRPPGTTKKPVTPEHSKGGAAAALVARLRSEGKGPAGLPAQPYKPRCAFGGSHAWIQIDDEAFSQCSRCGSMSSAYEHSKGGLEDREPNADEWCCDSCGLIAPAETKGWEQTAQDDAGVSVEFCPHCKHDTPSQSCRGTREIYVGSGGGYGSPGSSYAPCGGCPDCRPQPNQGSDGETAGQRIRRHRLSAGLTVDQLAREAEVDAGVLASVEGNPNSSLSVSAIGRVASALGLRNDTLANQGSDQPVTFEIATPEGIADAVEQSSEGSDQPIASSSSSAQPCSPPGDETALGNAEVSDRTIAGPDGAKEAGAGRSEIEHLADEVVRFAHDKLHDPEAADPSAMHAATDAALAANPDQPKDQGGDADGPESENCDPGRHVTRAGVDDGSGPETSTGDQPKDCGGSGWVNDWQGDGHGGMERTNWRPCPGCSHADCPNRDQAKASFRTTLVEALEFVSMGGEYDVAAIERSLLGGEPVAAKDERGGGSDE